jgi:hypothetical protein
VPGGDAAPTTSLQDGVHGDQLTVLKNADLTGGAVHLDHAPSRRIRHTIQVSVERDHAVSGDASFKLQHGLKWPARRGLQVRLLLGKVFRDDTPRGGMRAPVGDVIQPLMKLRVEVIEIAEAATEKEVFAHIAERAFHFALGPRPVRSAGFRLVMIVFGEAAQGGIVDDVAVRDILAAEHSPHTVVEDLGRHAAKCLESGGVAAQQGRQILVQHEAAPLHPAVAEHQREQPDDPLGARLVTEDSAEVREIHLCLPARWRLEADFESGGLARTNLAQEVLHRRVTTAVAEFADLAMQPTAVQLRKRRDAVPQIAFERRQHAPTCCSRAVGRRFDAALDVFADRAARQPGAPGDGGYAQTLLVQLQDHNQLPKPDHPNLPRTTGGKVVTRRALPCDAALRRQPIASITHRSGQFSIARFGENSSGDDTDASRCGSSWRDDPVRRHPASPHTSLRQSLSRPRIGSDNTSSTIDSDALINVNDVRH